MEKIFLDKYKLWLRKAKMDKDLEEELNEINNNQKEIEDAFYKELEFGTGGLRGVIGAGTNRMNVYTVGKASQGVANYIVNTFTPETRKVAISYDSRIKSKTFAQIAAEVFAANGIHVYIYRSLMPTPCLSFAVRQLHCSAGIMITASHNPANYNGYKVYGNDGCQITIEAASKISIEINKVDVFKDIKRKQFFKAIENGCIEYIDDDIYTKYIEQVKMQGCIDKKQKGKEGFKIVYSPLNGTGLRPVIRTLKESGYKDILIVKEQEKPDGTFPTCPYPNPELEEAMSLGIEYAKRYNAGLVLATDPDCDRVGVAVKNEDTYTLLSGNEIGVLLLDYICSRRIANGSMPDHPVMIKSIVTTDLGERIASHYGVKTINVLTGFKFIGEKIGALEAQGKEKSFIFGFEESCGYLSGTYVRDKDAVNGSLLICEMYSFYAGQGISLVDKLCELYNLYGVYINTQYSYDFPGRMGLEHIQNIMKRLRENTISIGEEEIETLKDYEKGIEGLPKSNVLKIVLKNGSSIIIRPSGTEPKLKVYISVTAQNQEKAKKLEQNIKEDIRKILCV